MTKLKLKEFYDSDVDWTNYVFPSRYAARLALMHSLYHSSDDVIVRVTGGYVIMSASDYAIFRKER